MLNAEQIPHLFLRSRCQSLHGSLALIVFVFCLTACVLNAAPYIAEFQASNSGDVVDQDGDTSDWLEIHNPDPEPVDLEGMSLTDKVAQPRMWVFPSCLIPSGQSVLVWASSKDRRDPGQELHTNFNLSADGEYLALIAEDGVTKLSEFNPFPAQQPGRSYGAARAVTQQEVIAEGTDCRWQESSSDLESLWEQPDFDDSGWHAAKTGLGYDVITPDVDYLPFIGEGGNTESAMYGRNASCLVRIPFTLTAAEEVVAMKLRVRFDAGFAVFLNGVRLSPPSPSATNAPHDLAWDSEAPDSRVDSEAMLEEEFNLSAHVALLKEGENILAFQLMSHSITDPGLLLLPRLSVARRQPEAPLMTGFFAVPTPSTYNAETVYAGFAAAPTFSTRRNFLTGAQPLTLSTVTPNSQIRFTTDGSEPDENHGTLYTVPVTVTSTQVLKARAFRPGWHPSAVVSHTYIFPAQVIQQPAAPAGFPATWGWENLDSGLPVPADYAMDPGVTQAPAYQAAMIPALTETLPVVSLSLPQEQLFGLNGMYANGRMHRVEKPASMEFFDPRTGQTFYENAGLRIHGGNTADEHPKKPFRIFFRKRYGGTGELEFPLFPESSVAKFDVIQLRPGGHDGWAVPFGSGDEDLARHATYVRDRFLRQTELDSGRLSPRGRYVHLYLNGLYWGIYDLHEVPKEEFFADHLGGAKEEWDVVEHSNLSDPLFDVVDGEGDAMEDLLALCQPPEALADPARYQQVLDLLDVDDFIDHLIVQMWGANNDWMGPVYLGTENENASRFFNKNWQAARWSRGSTPGGYRWCVWDAEISLGSSHSEWIAHQREANFDHTRIGTPSSVSGIEGVPGPPAAIYYALKHNAAFRRRFGDRLHKHLFNGGALSEAKNQARLNALQAELQVAIVAESARWGDVNSGHPDTVTFTRDEHWLDELAWLKDIFIPERNSVLLEHCTAQQLWPSVPGPVFSQRGGKVEMGYQLEIQKPEGHEGVIYYTLDGPDPCTETGEIAEAAQVYDGPLPILRYTTVKARFWKDGAWSPLEEAAFSLLHPQIVLTEIFYNPKIRPAEQTAGFTAQQFEFLELTNVSEETADLTGYQFTEGIDFDFADAAITSLPPGGRLVLVSHAAAFTFRNPSVSIGGVFANETNLSNGGERLALVDGAGQTVFDFEYSDASPWPTSADGGGSSLVLIHPYDHPDPSLPANWRASVMDGGTPGELGADTYAAWALRNARAPVMTDDGNSNGLADLIEFALRPLASGTRRFSVAQRTLTVGDNPSLYSVVEYRQDTAAGQVLVTPELSDDLLHWEPAVPIYPSTRQPDGSENVIWRSTAPVTPGKRIFARLNLTLRPD